MNILDDVLKQKYETRKYHLMARYLENLVINADIESLKKLEDNSDMKPYIKYIGGIGNSRALEFCVPKICIEEKAIETILYILDRLEERKKNISTRVVNSMLNIAIIYEHEEIINFLFNHDKLKKKINFAQNDYMIIKNMTKPEDKEERVMLKKLLLSKSIPLDEKTRNLINKSRDQFIIEMVQKMDFKERIEKILIPHVNTKIKKKKI